MFMVLQLKEKEDCLLSVCCHSCLRAGVKNFSVPLVSVNLRCREVCSCVFMELPAE